MAFQTRDVVEVMRSDSGVEVTELKVDGGAAANDMLLQFQADLLGVPVRRSSVQETTALGAAYLAGLGAGVWSSTEELSSKWRLDRQFEPSDVAAADASYREWLRAVDRSLRWSAPRDDAPSDGVGRS
jgi:glycerol kinase